MNDVRSNSMPPLPPRRVRPGVGISGTAAGALAIVLAVLLLPIWFWFFCRIEPGSGEIAVLIRKTGEDLPSGQVLALEPDRKGIQLEVIAEGRYFRNPYTWGWEIHPITDIPAGKLGVKVRLFGEDLPPGEIIARGSSKGIEEDVLSPGKYRVNPYAYQVKIHDAITIRPGSVGVITSLVGRDVLNSDLPEDERNTFLVGKDLKGVLPGVLDSGTYYLNPYMVNVVVVNLQSQRFEMSGEDAITFLTLDGFTVMVEGTIEYALMRDQASLLTHRVGEMDDVLQKIILPKARGFSRIEGSKNPAKNYIMGDTRQQFQDNLDTHLRKQCEPWGVDIRSVLIRNITPPDQIASIIRDREVAVQTARKYEEQIQQAKSKAELVKQEMIAQQRKEQVEAETVRIRAVILAEQQQAVRLIDARKKLEVARLENEAATAQAAAMLLTANAERGVIGMRNEAEAGVLADQVSAFGSGMNLARHAFYERVGPRVSSILSSDDPGGLGGLFRPYVPSSGKEVSQ